MYLNKRTFSTSSVVSGKVKFTRLPHNTHSRVEATKQRKKIQNCVVGTSFQDIARCSLNSTFSDTTRNLPPVFLPTQVLEGNIQKSGTTDRTAKLDENLAMWMDKAIHARNVHDIRDSLSAVHAIACAEPGTATGPGAALIRNSHPTLGLTNAQQQFYPNLETLSRSPKFLRCLGQMVGTGMYAPPPGTNFAPASAPFSIGDEGQAIASDLISQMISKNPSFEARKQILQQLIMAEAVSANATGALNAKLQTNVRKIANLKNAPAPTDGALIINSTTKSVSATSSPSLTGKSNSASVTATPFRGSNHAVHLKQELHVRTQKMDMMEMESKHLVNQINHISRSYQELQSKYHEDIENKHREVLLLRKENALLMNQFGLRMVPNKSAKSPSTIDVAASEIDTGKSATERTAIITNQNSSNISTAPSDLTKKRKDRDEEQTNEQKSQVNTKKPRLPFLVAPSPNSLVLNSALKPNNIPINVEITPQKSETKMRSGSIADMMTLAQAANHKSQEPLMNTATNSSVHKCFSSSNLLKMNSTNIAQTQARERSYSEQFSNHIQTTLPRFRSNSQGDLGVLYGRARSQSDISLVNSTNSTETSTSESTIRRNSSSLDSKYLAIHSCRWKKRSSKGKISKTDLRVAHLPPVPQCTKHKFCRGGCKTVAMHPDFQQRLRDEYCNFVREYDHHAGNLFLAKFLHPSQSKTKDTITRHRQKVLGATVSCVWCQTVPNQAFVEPHEWTRETCPCWNDAQNFHIQHTGVKKFHYSIPWIDEKNQKGKYIELCAPTFQAIYGLSSDRMTTVRKVRLHSSSYDETILDRRSFNGGHNAKSTEEQKALEAVLESEPRSCFKSADGSGKSIYYYKGNLSRFHFWRKYLLTNGNIQDVEFVLQSERLKFYPTFHNPKKRKHFPTADIYAQDKAGKQLKPSIAYTTACTFWKNFDIRFAGHESDVLLLKES